MGFYGIVIGLFWLISEPAMINVNNRKLCENCFEEVSADTCPYCGFNRAGYMHDPITLEVGSVLDKRYLIGGVIGKGGFGITYLAYDLKLDTKIAVKEYYPMGVAIRNPGSMKVSVSNKDSEVSFKSGAEKFYNEAKVVARFNGNPNIVSVHDFFYENDTVYFTMGYLKGETLKSYLKKTRITEGQAVRVMQDISNALMASHSMNILHRDISPDNIMLCDDGSIKLLDFGAARQVMAEQSQSLSVILKQGYAPLEQYQKRGKQGPWTDIYALGATIYHSLTGVSIDDPMTRLEEDAEFASNKYGISDKLWAIIKKSMMIKIEDRYQDIFELKKDLNNVGIEPEPFIDVKTGMEEIPDWRMAKSFESRTEDDNATELLTEYNVGSPGGNETVALEPGYFGGTVPQAGQGFVIDGAQDNAPAVKDTQNPVSDVHTEIIKEVRGHEPRERSHERRQAGRTSDRKRGTDNRILIVMGAMGVLIAALIVTIVVIAGRNGREEIKAEEITEEAAGQAADPASEEASSEETSEEPSEKASEEPSEPASEEALQEEEQESREEEEEVVEEVKDEAAVSVPYEDQYTEDEKLAMAADSDVIDNHTYYEIAAPDGYVNLRTGPGTEYDIITPIPNGEFVQSLDERAKASNGKTWAKVAWWADGHVEGWVIASQIK
jgi:serine/threonine protein kinase